MSNIWIVCISVYTHNPNQRKKMLKFFFISIYFCITCAGHINQSE